MGEKMSHVQVELTPDSEAVEAKVTNEGWSGDDPAYEQNAQRWPRILSRLKTLLEAGKMFRPHRRHCCNRIHQTARLLYSEFRPSCVWSGI
jgi:hypothetical protein